MVMSTETFCTRQLTTGVRAFTSEMLRISMMSSRLYTPPTHPESQNVNRLKRPQRLTNTSQNHSHNFCENEAENPPAFPLIHVAPTEPVFAATS